LDQRARRDSQVSRDHPDWQAEDPDLPGYPDGQVLQATRVHLVYRALWEIQVN